MKRKTGIVGFVVTDVVRLAWAEEIFYSWAYIFWTYPCYWTIFYAIERPFDGVSLLEPLASVSPSFSILKESRNV
jgi:hypothetical protein